MVLDFLAHRGCAMEFMCGRGQVSVRCTQAGFNSVGAELGGYRIQRQDRRLATLLSLYKRFLESFQGLDRLVHDPSDAVPAVPGGILSYLAGTITASLNMLLVFLQRSGQGTDTGGQLLDP
ncbi:hypothetical protein [Kineosporia sp. NBRC 101731]|uniref:hypothetical protein n=1 Tax=Kineosporia sp. NBRC 101731 TaxID=3032199 RepID=UPI0024A10354|nr:hypothetical protein [Kineosporia sp. NBRC 101731]GLY29818.1 hypothetical protein Kisp02_31830 [Kineosporia sp. NBRC 101731]